VWLLPVLTLVVALYPHAPKLDDHVVKAHGAWYDAIGHMYVSWERFRALTFQTDFFDFLWFHPYANTGTFNEPSVAQGLLFGLFNSFIAAEPLAFNVAMIAILVLNLVACYLLLRDIVDHRWIAMVFAHVGAFSPFAWTRYAHPSNTVIFFGILGLLFLRLAARDGRWRWCILAPLMFVLQFYSTLYVGMFFAFVLGLYLPWTLGRASVNKVFTRVLVRMALAAALMLPSVYYLYQAYSMPVEQLGEPNTYHYVCKKFPKGVNDIMNKESLDCHLRLLGKEVNWRECRPEMYPGRLAVWGGLVGLLAAIVAASRVPRESLLRSALRWGAVLIGLKLAFYWDKTLPLHVGIWIALLVPGKKPGGSVGLRGEIAVPLACLLLILDIAVNPTVAFYRFKLQSIFYYIFEHVPGAPGLRSEYRIVVLVPVFLAIIGAWGAKQIITVLENHRHRFIAAGALLALSGVAVVTSLPSWQTYAAIPSSTRLSPVLRAARDLPADAVMSVIGASGTRIRREKHSEDGYSVAYAMFHRHRQVSGRATHRSPAARAISTAVKLDAERLLWTARVARLFGTSHLIVDWHRGRAPAEKRLVEMLKPVPTAKLLVRSRHMALVELGDMPEVARGPVADLDPPGRELRPVAASASDGAKAADHVADGNVRTVWSTGRPQQADDWIAISFDEPATILGLGYTPGLQTATLPFAFAVEVKKGDDWVEVGRKERWEVPQSLVDKPRSGRLVVSFEPVETTAVRVRLVDGSPWPLTVAEMVGFAPP